MEREEIEQLIEGRQYNELRKELIDLNEADIASIMEDVPKEERLRIFRLLKKDVAADVFSYQKLKELPRIKRIIL